MNFFKRLSVKYFDWEISRMVRKCNRLCRAAARAEGVAERSRVRIQVAQTYHSRQLEAAGKIINFSDGTTHAVLANGQHVNATKLAKKRREQSKD
jgi:hypothetical protein